MGPWGRGMALATIYRGGIFVCCSHTSESVIFCGVKLARFAEGISHFQIPDTLKSSSRHLASPFGCVWDTRSGDHCGLLIE